MSDLVSSQRAPRTTAEYRSAIEEMMAEMERLNEQMKSDQARIDELKAETAVIKTETRAKMMKTLPFAALMTPVGAANGSSALR